MTAEQGALRIERIDLKTFKGLTETFELEQVNVFVGGMGSGKTRRLISAGWAITGSTPNGATCEAGAKLGKNKNLGVRLTLNDGFTWQRRIVHNTVNHSLKMRIDLAGCEDDGIETCEPLVHKHVGNFAPTFDIQAFLGLSDERRRDFVLALCSKEAKLASGGDLPHEAVVEFCNLELGPGTVTEASHGHGGPGPELTEKLLSRMSEDRRKAFEMIAGSIESRLKAKDVAAAIAAAMKQANNDANGYRASAKTASATARKLSDRKNELTIVSDSVEAMQERVRDLRERKEVVVRALGLADGLAQSVADHRRTIDECNTASEKADAELTAIAPPDTESVEKTALALEEQAAALEKLGHPVNPSLGAVGKAAETAETADRKNADAAATAGAQLNAAKAALETARKELEKAKQSPWVRCLEISREVDGPIGELLVDKPLIREPYTERTEIIVANADAGVVEHCRDAVSVAEEGVNAEQDLHDKTVAASKEASSASVAALALLDADVLAFETARQEYDDARQQAVDLRTDAKNARDAAQATHDQIEKLNRHVDDLRATRLAHEGRLNALLEEAGESVDEMRQRSEAMASEIDSIDSRLEAKQRYQQLEGELARCQASAELELINHDVANKYALALGKLRNKLMGALVEPLRTRIDWFLDKAGIRHHSYFSLESDRGRPTFDLGWVVDDAERIDLDVLSGGESAIFCAALAYAIVELADPPLKILSVEFEAVHANHVNGLLDAFVAVGARGMQVIAATHVEISDCPAGVNLMQCSPQGVESPVGV